MKRISQILILTLAVAISNIEAANTRPVVFKFKDKDGQDRIGVVKESVFRSLYPNDDSYDESLESIEQRSDGNAYLHEYSRHPHKGSDSLKDIYHMSDELTHEEEQRDQKKDPQVEASNVYTKHIYANDYSESNSHSEEQNSEPAETTFHSSEEISKEEPEEDSHDEEKCSIEKCHKCQNKKMVYVYKQPPIYIKQKPIVVRPPPLVVHQEAPKPCNPVIRYKPPSIRVQPVIVKIKKPKTTTTTTTTSTTTPCPPKTTTKKPCKKCRRKPSRKCNRCEKKKSRDYSVYYNNNFEGVLT